MSDFKPRRAGFERSSYDRALAKTDRLRERLPDRDVRAVANEVLSRLSLGEDGAALSEQHGEEIEALCTALLSESSEAGADFVDALVQDGASLDMICLDYLAPAARAFGARWERDQASFVEVTIGVGRIMAILRALKNPAPRQVKRQALFATVPGETHVLGVRMAADLFRERGWDIELCLDAGLDAIVNRLIDAEHGLIGLSAAGRHSLLPLAELIAALRIARPDCFILISGQVLRDAPEEIDALMPDGTSNDIDTAEALFLAAGATAPG